MRCEVDPEVVRRVICCELEMSLANKSLKSIQQGPMLTVASSTTAADALELARSKQVHHLPVVDDGKLVGLVCTCDLHDVSKTDLVRQAMSSPAATLRDSESALSAALRIKSEGIGSIVVVDETDTPTGIVTRGDLVRSDDDGKKLLADQSCVCCGLTRHLRPDEHGQLLCIYCHEGATDGSWLDLGSEVS